MGDTTGGRRRPRHADPSRPPSTAGHWLALAFTVILLPVAAALLTSRVRLAVGFDGAGQSSDCAGAQLLGPFVLIGVPLVVLAFAIVVALVSLGRRARGWIWLLAALAIAVGAHAVATRWLPACL